ncbi:MAG: bifunctional ornithine acetyltransferase/N-acetylglutamate synthase, partial [Thermoplasmata archaeon]|nr:bifunctional ornithine acetyltransferase/N-acetylglutamate synthase [Thermoplasmata archaeon]
MLHVAGGITAPHGFRAAGVSSGVKRSGRSDLSIIASDTECDGAGVFTTNRVRAAPVVLGAERLDRSPSHLRGILTVSGVANALTGPEGIDDNRRLLDAAEMEFGFPAGSLLPACTGVIGPRLPVDRIVAALPHLRAALDASG